MSPAVVEFQSLGKTYHRGWMRRRAVRALRNVTFSVPRGCVFGVVGPESCGEDHAGENLVVALPANLGNGLPLRAAGLRPPHARQVGYLHESQAFPTYLSARALFAYYGGLSFVSARELARRIPRLLEQVGLADRASEPIATFSKGMLQRLALAQSLVNDPQLLVLDEPTAGMDVAAASCCGTSFEGGKRKGTR